MDTPPPLSRTAVAKALLLGSALLLGGVYLLYLIVRVATQDYVVLEGTLRDMQTAYTTRQLRGIDTTFETFSFKIGNETVRHEPSEPEYEMVVRLVSRGQPIKVWAMRPVIPGAGDSLPLRKLEAEGKVIDLEKSPTEKLLIAVFGVLIALTLLGYGGAQLRPLYRRWKMG